jgi:hypothetical protein
MDVQRELLGAVQEWRFAVDRIVNADIGAASEEQVERLVDELVTAEEKVTSLYTEVVGK